MSQATLGANPFSNAGLFTGYYLNERVRELDDWDCDAEAEAAFETLQQLWADERETVGTANERTLQSNWIDPVLEALGFGTLQEPSLPSHRGQVDELLFTSEEDRRQAAEMMETLPDAAFSRATALLEAKQWGDSFNETFDERRNYNDASQQIRFYLEKTPEAVSWGILTNGREWRLYSMKDYATETYYEVNLPELLETGDLEGFKYFYAFFRPDAFQTVGDRSFLDAVYDESETAAQELGENLQDSVFTALRVVGEGFVASNDLDIDPDDEAALAHLKQQSLVLLYRLMFVLYAESRRLIEPDDPDARDEYRREFSLNELRSEVERRRNQGEQLSEFSERSFTMWSKLQQLFDLIDTGEPSLGIPPYNGGLFDQSDHEFLSNHRLSNRYVAEVIHRIGTTDSETQDGVVLADYADLDTRHLGSIYEGLLEHQFKLAPEEYVAVTEGDGQVWKPAATADPTSVVERVSAGSLYVVNDDDERKATGAYYTPDYVVTYIIEETIDPLIDEIDRQLRARGKQAQTQAYFEAFCDAVLELTVLDPAMGSGHFLTRATGYLTERVMEVARELDETDANEQELRRRISKECIYGVDVNGMAVELAKLSMWLETLAADKPLAFLNHHLKVGNSLVGSDITAVLGETAESSEPAQYTLEQDFSRTRRDVLDQVMGLMRELLAIDNDTLDDIKSMERTYAEIRDDPVYERLLEVANVHTAERFGLDVTVEGTRDVYERMAEAVTDDEAWAEIREQDWFQSAQAMADDESFFHWELEFPAVFFDDEGEKRADAGFDVVVGNPPYGMISYGDLSQYCTSEYSCAQGRPERYAFFVEKAHRLAAQSGFYGYIVSNTILTNKLDSKLRSMLLQRSRIASIVLYEEPVFGDPTIHSATFISQKEVNSGNHETKVVTGVSTDDTEGEQRLVLQKKWVENENSTISIIPDPDIARTWWSLSETGEPLGEIAHIRQCIKTGDNSKYLSEFDTDPGQPWKPVLTGSDLSRYHINWGNKYVKYGDWLARNWKNKDFYEREKIAIRETSDRITAARDPNKRYFLSTLYSVYYKPNHDYDLRYLLGIINSDLAQFFMYHLIFSTNEGAFTKARTNHYERLPIVLPDTEDGSGYQEVIENVSRVESYLEDQSYLNLDLADHLGSYSSGKDLTEVGFTQPPEGSADVILQQTTTDRPNLRVGEVSVERESDTTVTVSLTARYKPEESGTHDGRDPDSVETDQWGYRETDPLPALRITDLTETEADLIESFVPYAVAEAGGFAGFRETATKTNSLVDRLRALTLPRVADVRGGLESYREAVERAAELDRKIERTDQLIDEIVYDLYGLTDEEIEIVEDSVGD